MRFIEMRYKTCLIAPLGSRSDGRDALLGGFISAVITLAFKAHALIVIRWSTRPLDRRASIKLHPIRRLPFRHVSCILNKNRVELRPTREKLRKIVGFIKSDGFRGLIFPSDKHEKFFLE